MGFRKEVADPQVVGLSQPEICSPLKETLLIEFLRGSAFTFWHDQVCAPAKD